MTARSEEFEGVPEPIFAVNGEVVHISADGAAFAFCGEPIGYAWQAHAMNLWHSDWRLCESCGHHAAELEALSRPSG
jgi:hypothetical protein